jgi:polyhydroxyalkanoate synthase
MSKPDLVPAPRVGPRPLPLHLLTALQSWSGSELGLTLWSSASPSSSGVPFPNRAASPDQPPPDPPPSDAQARAQAFRNVFEPLLAEIAAARAQAGVGDADPASDPFRQALRREVARRLDRLAIGVQAYRDHPSGRMLDDPPVVWREGATVLRDVGAAEGVRFAADATPVLVVPSLVNRWQVMDLAPGRSFVRALASEGLRPYIVDWGTPGDAERALDTAGCVVRLGRALAWLKARAGKPLPVIGYCMGGTLVVGLAAHRPRDVSALVALAAPWDFHADRAGQGLLVATGPWLAEFALRGGELPTDAIQALFWSLDPWLVVNKFQRFAGMDMDSDAARDFVLLEDWLNDGAALPALVARDCLVGWYGQNVVGRGEWRIARKRVRPREIAVPSLVVIPANDRIVPPASAAALVGPQGLANATRLDLPLGHIGMMVGSRAIERCWRPVIDWLKANA